MNVSFYELNTVDDVLLKYAVIVSRYKSKWIYCKHRKRDTWEIPGGRREENELIIDTAKRELYEETGALDFKLKPIYIYSVLNDGNMSYGLLSYADVKELGPIPPSEIERIKLFDYEPELLTYPHIQPYLFEKVRQYLR